MENNELKIESWMFRSKYEYISLIFTIFLVLLFGFLLSTINIYITLFAFVMGVVLIRLQQAQYIGNAIKVDENQFSDIFEVFNNFTNRLDIKRVNLFLKQDPVINAYTLGLEDCTVVLTTSLVENLTKKELQFVIAHELGHYKLGHTKISSLINPVGMSNFVNTYIFGFWQRKAEISADQCALILTKDIDSAISSLIKITIGSKLFDKLNLEAYISQIESSESMSTNVSEMLNSHPHISKRIKNLLYFWKNYFYNNNEKK
jgi:Zn-dependent protease with chaperone function